MPAFNTHWLVAILVRNSVIQEIRDGFDTYQNASNELREKLIRQFEYIAGKSSYKESKKAFKLLIEKSDQGTFIAIINSFEDNLKKEPNYTNITCFSAYMLGACGPDFWTVLSGSKRGVIPDTAGIHFDMGHYNRTARQFQVAIERWKKEKLSDLQRKVEVSYFLGMATHIAADTILHQLVNVYAGAFHLMKKKWEYEFLELVLMGRKKRDGIHLYEATKNSYENSIVFPIFNF